MIFSSEQLQSLKRLIKIICSSRAGCISWAGIQELTIKRDLPFQILMSVQFMRLRHNEIMEMMRCLLHNIVNISENRGYGKNFPRYRASEIRTVLTGFRLSIIVRSNGKQQELVSGI